ncbi:MAG: signal peptide peptidase SppA, partial [Sphingopyxis sp.]
MTDTTIDPASPLPAPSTPPGTGDDAGGPRTIKRYTTRQVLRSAWRILVAVKDGLALLFLLLFFAILAGVLTARPNPAQPTGDGALVLRLNGFISEQPAPVDPFAAFSGGKAPVEYRAGDLVRALGAAATDARVKLVVLDLDNFHGAGQVSLGEVGAALDAVRAARKPVLAYATAYSDDGYQLAAHASEIWTQQGGGVMVAGPGGSRLYYKGLMDKLGVQAHIYRVGTFKSAVEPYLRADQSPEAAQAARAYMGVMWNQWLAQVKRARPAARIDAYIADPVAAMRAANNDVTAASKAAGLIDKIGTRLEFDRYVGTLAGTRDENRPWAYNRIKLNDWIAANPAPTTGERIAIVPIVGNIVDGRADSGTAGGDSIAAHILDAVADEDVKAIVVRVDSRGGSVTASERIRSALMEAKRVRHLPIVISMGNVAASGGYWVSTPADRIFAQPDTITGSIGVFGVLPSFERALGSIGVTTDGEKTTALSGQPDVFAGTNAE